MYIIKNYMEYNNKGYFSEPMPKQQAEDEYKIIFKQFRLGLQALEPVLIRVSV